MLGLGQLIEKGHNVETRVLQQPEAQGRVFKLLHIPAIFEIFSQGASGGVRGKGGGGQSSRGASRCWPYLLRTSGPGQVLGGDTHRAGFCGVKGMLREQQAASW